MLVYFKNKIINPEVKDSAEISDPNVSRVLYNIIMKNMIDCLCGDWCIDDVKCSKHYPKQYQDETIYYITDEGGYPHYSRKDIYLFNFQADMLTIN